MSLKEKLKAKAEIAAIDEMLKGVDWKPNQKRLLEVTRVLAILSRDHGYSEVFMVGLDKSGVDDCLAELYVKMIKEVVE